MRHINSITLTGRAGDDARYAVTPSGKHVVNVSLAFTEREQDERGEWRDGNTTWFRVALWDKNAEVIARDIRRGDLVVVTGRVRLRTYERRDGGEGYSLEIIADHLGLSAQPPAKAGGDAGGFGGGDAGGFGGGGFGGESSPWG